MPRRARVDTDAVDALLRSGRMVATHSALQATGLPLSTIVHRIRPGGPWRRLLPGVVLAHRGTPNLLEQRIATLEYGGESAVLTGLDALAELGVRTALQLHPGKVHILISHSHQRTSHGFAVVTRSRRMPNPVLRRGLRIAPLARALVDACRRLDRLDDVRELVADVVQNHGVKPAEIREELEQAQRQRTALARQVMKEIAAGVRFAAEARLREAFLRYGVPQPLWNINLVTPDGVVVASPDGYWPEYGVAIEVDSMAWHLSPRAYKATQRRQRRLVMHDVEVIPVSPADVLADPEALCRQILLKLRRSSARTLPELQVQERFAS